MRDEKKTVSDAGKAVVGDAPRWLVPGLIALAVMGGTLYMLKSRGPAPQVVETLGTATPAP